MGVSLASDHGWGSGAVIGSLVLGLVVLAWYTHRQLNTEKPVLNLRAFAIPGFRMGAVLVMINFGIILSAMYLLPMVIQKGLLIPVALTGIIMFVLRFFFWVLVVSAIIGIIKFVVKLFLGLAVGFVRFALWALFIGGTLWVINLIVPLF